MATNPDLHSGGPGFESWCHPTKVWSLNTTHTPPPGHKDVSRAPLPKRGPCRMVYAEGRAPRITEKNLACAFGASSNENAPPPPPPVGEAEKCLGDGGGPAGGEKRRANRPGKRRCLKKQKYFCGKCDDVYYRVFNEHLS